MDGAKRGPELYVRKVVLVGDSGVGKTSLIRRFVHDDFSDKYLTTFGTKVTKKELSYAGGRQHLALMLWDVLGQKTRAFSSVYYKGARGAILVCDVTRAGTVEHIPLWLDGLRPYLARDAPCSLFANKSDLPWGIERAALEDQARRYGLPLLVTSAKTGEGVEAAFLDLGSRLLAQAEGKEVG